jgi:hypothetical protein
MAMTRTSFAAAVLVEDFNRVAERHPDLRRRTPVEATTAMSLIPQPAGVLANHNSICWLPATIHYK